MEGALFHNAYTQKGK